jgi:hypothetical protein
MPISDSLLNYSLYQVNPLPTEIDIWSGGDIFIYSVSRSKLIADTLHGGRSYPKRFTACARFRLAKDNVTVRHVVHSGTSNADDRRLHDNNTSRNRQ